MGIEKERGISVVTSVMTFEYGDCVFNLLDTPGHEDFSEDTYRTLTAVDSAVMVIDAAKAFEARTRKLFEVCRLRDIPIVTFVNKLDRNPATPSTFSDEIEKTLALDVAPSPGRSGAAGSLRHLRPPAPPVRRLDAADDAGTVPVSGLDDPLSTPCCRSRRRRDLARGGGTGGGRLQAVRPRRLPRGHLTPVFFGSACAISACAT